MRTALPVLVNRTVKSAVLLPATDPEWIGPLIELIVPPHRVSRRGVPE
jgi:hypothetical protein